MKLLEVIKEEMKNSPKEIKEKTIKKSGKSINPLKNSKEAKGKQTNR